MVSGKPRVARPERACGLGVERPRPTTPFQGVPPKHEFEHAMPRRNLLILLLVLLLAVVCYPRVQQGPYARVLNQRDEHRRAAGPGAGHRQGAFRGGHAGDAQPVGRLFRLRHPAEPRQVLRDDRPAVRRRGDGGRGGPRDQATAGPQPGVRLASLPGGHSGRRPHPADRQNQRPGDVARGRRRADPRHARQAGDAHNPARREQGAGRDDDCPGGRSRADRPGRYPQPGRFVEPVPRRARPDRLSADHQFHGRHAGRAERRHRVARRAGRAGAGLGPAGRSGRIPDRRG